VMLPSANMKSIKQKGRIQLHPVERLAQAVGNLLKSS